MDCDRDLVALQRHIPPANAQVRPAPQRTGPGFQFQLNDGVHFRLENQFQLFCPLQSDGFFATQTVRSVIAVAVNTDRNFPGPGLEIPGGVPTKNFIAQVTPPRIEAESIRERFGQLLFGSVQRKKNKRLELNWVQQAQCCQPSLP